MFNISPPFKRLEHSTELTQLREIVVFSTHYLIDGNMKLGLFSREKMPSPFISYFFRVYFLYNFSSFYRGKKTNKTFTKKLQFTIF